MENVKLNPKIFLKKQKKEAAQIALRRFAPYFMEINPINKYSTGSPPDSWGINT